MTLPPMSPSRSTFFQASWFMLGTACLSLSLSTSLCAQTPPPEKEKEKKEDVSWLRCWASVGENPADSPCTVTFLTSGAKDELPLFKGVRGCWSSGIGTGYFPVPPGKHLFRLRRDNKPEEAAVELNVELQKDHASTLFATVSEDKPALQLIPEMPTPPEAQGVFIYNLLPDTPLNLTLGTSPPVVIPAGNTPMVLPPSQVMGQNPVLWFLSKRKTRVETRMEYTGGRLSILLMRNHYNQPAVQFFPARPSQLP